MILKVRISNVALLDEERQDNQDHKERTRQNSNTAEVTFDVSVIGIELGCARRIHERRGPAHLSSSFLCHKNLLFCFVIGSRYGGGD